MKPKTLTLFRTELITHLPDSAAQQRAGEAADRFLDVNEIRNGRLHTDATTWTACLGWLGLMPSDAL